MEVRTQSRSGCGGEEKNPIILTSGSHRCESALKGEELVRYKRAQILEIWALQGYVPG